MTEPTLRLAIDIGGTFTDTVLADGAAQILAANKVLTTHDDPGRAALQGAQKALAAVGRSMAEVTGVIHGTTLATNALIERRGARCVTVTTEGFRDILDIAYERRYAQYDIAIEKPAPLVRRDACLTVRERMDVRGEVLVPLENQALEQLIGEIADSEATAVAVCLMHAYANPNHERRLRAALAAALPHVHVAISSEVSAEAREYDRLCTTLANAYIQPLMDGYLDRFQAGFETAGLRAPILMMTAAGGMCTVGTARKFPIRLVESGPAGGAILAAQIAREAGLDRVLSFDMGGTTAKLCLIDKGRPQTSRSFEIARAARFVKGSGLPVRIPVINMIEIGAGGGSVAAVDDLGRLTVGPESAGSDPGPVGFGRGGDRPTVTDADLSLGYLRPDWFADGVFAPDAEASTAAIAAKIGAPLGLASTDAARGICQMVDENMAAAGRMHAVETGTDLSDRVMIAFGGNGPLHAGRVARAAGVREILIPPSPGVGSAVGFVHAPVSYELVRSHYTRLTGFDAAQVAELLAQMEAEATEVVAQGASDAAPSITRRAFMRYAGQGHEIEIPLPPGVLTPAHLEDLRAAFEAEYRRQFSRPVPGMEIEILNWSVSATVAASLPTPSAQPAAAPTHVPLSAPPDPVEIVCDVTGRLVAAPVIPRSAMPLDAVLSGPALIVEPQTTTLVSADMEATCDAFGNLRLTRRVSEEPA